ncbi:hypothetical protein [Streptomyces sp. NPDC054958]
MPEMVPEETGGRVQVTEATTTPGTADHMAHLPAVALVAAGAYLAGAVKLSRAHRVV